ncbi:40S ribosomal protein S5 [Aureobasidium sp. EXF-10727]|nr:40S ribosomal protein S5 [Aureobasidium sp. EXF-10727]
MSDAGEIEVEQPQGYPVLPKDVAQEIGSVKLFNKWTYEDVEIRDISLTRRRDAPCQSAMDGKKELDAKKESGAGAGLERETRRAIMIPYHTIQTGNRRTYEAEEIRQPVYLPHSAGRYAQKRFRKAQCPIIERLTNALMMNGRNNGKKIMAVRIVAHAFEIIHIMTDQNPIQIAVDAIVNCGPREDSTRIGSAGTVRRQAVDVSPLRRVNQAIALLTIGAREAAFRNIKSVAECLAEELINAAKGSSNSYAIKKKDELERVAKSNR